MTAALEELRREVDRFRAWADTHPVEERSGEWEVHYNGWEELNEAFIAFVSSASCADWDAETTETVLYTIARDNDAGERPAKVPVDRHRAQPQSCKSQYHGKFIERPVNTEANTDAEP